VVFIFLGGGNPSQAVERQIRNIRYVELVCHESGEESVTEKKVEVSSQVPPHPFSFLIGILTLCGCLRLKSFF